MNTKPKYILIENKKDLDILAEKLELKTEIAVDLEGESNLHRYGIHLCFIQLYDAENIYLIDPIKIKDLSSLVNIFENKNIIKIMYSADFDIRLLKKTINVSLVGLEDLQVGIQLLEIPKTSLNNAILEMLEIDLNKKKKNQKSDWTKRPLSTEQLDYAADDVRYLFDIKKELIPKLTDKKLMDIYSAKSLKLEKVEFLEKANPWLSIKGTGRLNKQQKIYLKYFFTAREIIAEKLELPPYWIIPNDVLINICINPPKNESDWNALKKWTNKIRPFIKKFVFAKENADKNIFN